MSAGSAASTASALYEQRQKRLLDAIELREPDRLPTILFSHFWVARYCGMTCREAMYDYDRLAAALRKAVIDLEPDAFQPVHALVAFGPTMDILDYKQLEWPGHKGLAEDVGFQYLDAEYMAAEEYGDYLLDPTGFVLHKYMPRVAGALEPLSQLPEYPGVLHTRIIQSMEAYARPDVRRALRTLIRAGEEMQKMRAAQARVIQELKDLGFPVASHGTSHAPFDVAADYLRGSKGAMLDLFRNKEKLLSLLDRLATLIPSAGIAAVKAAGGNMIFIPLHWGLDGFMSPKQFTTFFWPQFHRVLLALIEAGIYPHVLWEGDCTSRLDVIKDVPPGKCVYFFERTDMIKAKEALRGTVCIRGNVPASMLITGTPRDVREQCKKLFDVVGDGGGFILDAGVGVPDEAKPENVLAMYEFAKECIY
ncbi:MAG TPA: uroporphyrinogen decarboxylase family protein [Candidatus Acidoferrum sp.]|nr:uroporphyrinogen decarboxylase family protein [Candidatus Acidoferrum sp.]